MDEFLEDFSAKNKNRGTWPRFSTFYID